jgi:Uma2 family endonuclease
MATSPSLVSVEDYLRSSYKPACEYIDGVLWQKPMPTYKHGKMEYRVSMLINTAGIGFEAIPEQTVQLRSTKFLVPDVAVQRTADLQQPYPSEPIHLCVEILSPEDRLTDTVAKCQAYHAWGVKDCWIIDPDGQRCWQYSAGQEPLEIFENGQLTAGEIIIPRADLFAGF